MAQRIKIDLKKNPEVAEVVADMGMGERIELIASIAAKDDQTLTIELEEVDKASGASDADDTEDEETEDDEEEDTGAKDIFLTKK